MHVGGEVLKMLVPDNISWTITGDDYSGIVWHNSDPYITESEFNQGKLDLNNYLEEKESERISKKQIALQKIEQLGLTEEDILLIMGG
jgi:hypothetical protein